MQPSQGDSVGGSFVCADCRTRWAVQQNGATGYAVLSESGEKVCYSCADARQRKEWAENQRFFAYLDSDGVRIITWTGGTLAHVKRRVERKLRGFGGVEYTRTYVVAVDGAGQEWFGSGPGCGMYVKLRRRVAQKGVSACE